MIYQKPQVFVNHVFIEGGIFMLKEMIILWKSKGLMRKVVEEFGEMLNDDGYIFSQAWRAFENSELAEELTKPVHDRDRAVNEREREIRRMLLEHLAMTGGQDSSGCLVMMSLVKDAERIGDYSKNIFDLALLLDKSAPQMKYFGRFSELQGKLGFHLKNVQKAFLGEDELLAQKILDDYAPLKEECSKLLEDLFADELPTREAVATTLLSRYFKRINSHVSNIASGLVYPLDQIDFVRGDISD